MSNLSRMKNKACIIALFEIHVYGEYKSDNGSKTSSDAIAFLFREGLISKISHRGGKVSYELTERGIFWIEAVANMPLPVSIEVWKIPTEGD